MHCASNRRSSGKWRFTSNIPAQIICFLGCYHAGMRLVCRFLPALFLFFVFCPASFSENPSGIPLGLAVPNMQQIAPTVFVKELSPGAWVYTVIGKLGDGSPYPANGLLVITGNWSVLIDAGWEPGQAEALLAFAKDKLHRPVKQAVITHWHQDRAFGIPTLEKAKVEVYALDMTAKFLAEKKRPLPDHLLRREQMPYTEIPGIVIDYPGPGHTPDNLVVYLQKEKILDGGCFLKSANVDDLGNLEDANLAEWPKSLAYVTKKYADAKLVIPGHGPIAGDAMGQTGKLLREHGK